MKNRLQAFLTHVILSIIVAITVITLVFVVWYPNPLHEAAGVTHIFLLLLTIDIILGPLLTLITFKPTTGFLKFDLPIIVLLQIMALSYGVHTVFVSRPAFVVFSRGTFHLVRVLDLDANSVQRAIADGNQTAESSLLQPKWVAAVPPTDVKRLNEVMFSAVDWNQLPESYQPLEQAKDKLLAKAKSVAELRLLHSQNPEFTALNLPTDDSVKWLPLRGLEKDMVVLIDANSAQVIKVLNVKPWKNVE